MDFDSDSPIQDFEEDRFAFAEFARGLARQLLDYQKPTSFVIGINGAWGTGKTSLLRLLERAIRANETHAVPMVLQYSPWLVRNREGLLRELLPELSNQIRRRFSSSPLRRDVKVALLALDRYAGAIRAIELGLSLAIATATIASVPVVPWLAPIAAFFNGLWQYIGLGSGPPTLDDLKNDAHAALKVAAIRVVLVIDDLDRLEPSEILDMTRLVRSTLDLPYIAFVVAYDRSRVAASIEGLLGIDGESYLEKIVQLPVDVPHCDSYDLARSFAERLGAALPDIDQSQVERVSLFIWRDMRQRFLSTPRDVGRILNATGFGWTRLHGEADAGDHLVVTTLRVKAPRVFEWSLTYCATYYTDRSRVFSADTLRDQYEKSLRDACAADQLVFEDVISFLRDVLPGIARSFPPGKHKLFEARQVADEQAAARQKRLASAQHWRAYFDLTPGRSGFSEKQFSDFVLMAVSDPKLAISSLIAFASKKQAVGDTVAERLIDRIRAEGRGASLDMKSRVALFDVMTNAADEVAEAAGPPTFFQTPSFIAFDWTAAALLAPLEEMERVRVLLAAMRDGEAVGWLSHLVRSELFAHGRIGDRQEKGSRLVESDSLDKVAGVAIERLRALARSGTLLDIPELATPLLLWRDLGHEAEVREWVARATESDEATLRFVEALKGRVNSTSGDYWRVDRELVSWFCDYEALVARLRQIEATADQGRKQRAIEAIKMLTRERR